MNDKSTGNAFSQWLRERESEPRSRVARLFERIAGAERRRAAAVVVLRLVAIVNRNRLRVAGGGIAVATLAVLLWQVPAWFVGGGRVEPAPFDEVAGLDAVTTHEIVPADTSRSPFIERLAPEAEETSPHSMPPDPAPNVAGPFFTRADVPWPGTEFRTVGFETDDRPRGATLLGTIETLDEERPSIAPGNSPNGSAFQR